MSGRGRPIRFLLLFGAAWIGGRAFALWPAIERGAGEAMADIIPVTRHAEQARAGPRVPATLHASQARQVRAGPNPLRMGHPFILRTANPTASHITRRAPDRMRIAFALASLVRFDEPQDFGAAPPPRTDPRRPATRWSASAWLVARGGGARADSAQLGGSQAGGRIRYALDDARAWSLAGSVSTPLNARGSEVAVGVEWRPFRVPVALIAEHRFGFDGLKGGPAIGVVGGFGPKPVAGGVMVDGYGQAGVIRRARTEPYADGAVRAMRTVAKAGTARVELGVGTWGGIQRGASRLDVGPGASVAIPVAGRTVRVGVDWRQRVAGNARPGSGLAVTAGVDF